MSERRGFVASFNASRTDSIGLAGEAKSFTAWGRGIASKATCLAAGLQQQISVQFKYRPIMKTGPGDWSQAISFNVQ